MKTLPLRGSLGVLANGGVVSPGCRSRHSSTRSTPMLSSVQPVTAMDPASTVASPAGVSTTPKAGETGAVVETIVNRTLTGPAVLPDPLKAKAIVPVCDPVRPDAKWAAIVRVAARLQDVGRTSSHGVVE